jgi:hypothetical protein
MAIQQKTSTLGGTIPLQIPANEKIMSMEGQEPNSTSLSKFTLDKITYNWSNKPIFFPRKGIN